MKVRLGLVVLASGALALGLLAPGAVSAAPKAEKPSGQALVRIDGGTAYAKKKDKREYRIVVPQGASITWMGEVGGKGTRTGTFNPKALVAGWSRLGFREGARAFTTLTWTAAGDDRAEVRGVAIWSPRINADGQLTFLTKVTGGPLPKEMVDFSINIARAETRMRTQPRSGWTTVFPTFPIDSTFGLQATVTNDTSVSVAWPASSGPANPCRGPINVNAIQGIVNFPGFPCGDGNVNGKDSNGLANFVEFYSTKDGTDGLGQSFAYVTFQPTNGQPFSYNLLIAQWNGKGVIVMP